MSSKYPIPAQTRQQILTATAGQTVFGPLDFVLFDAGDAQVLAKAPAAKAWTLLDKADFTIAPAAPWTAFPAPFTVTLAVGRAVGDLVLIKGARLGSRTTDVTRGGVLRSQALETELDRQVITEQELRRDVDALLTGTAGASALLLASGVGNDSTAPGGTVAETLSSLDGRLDNLEPRVANLEGRERLLANRSYYIDLAAGSNLNTGLTAGSPFADTEYALNLIRQSIDMNGRIITINLSAGPQSKFLTKGSYTGGGIIVVQGPAVGVADIDGGGYNPIEVQGNAGTPIYLQQNIRVRSGGLNGIVSQINSDLRIMGGITIGQVWDVGGAQMYCSRGGYLEINGLNYIEGGGAYFCEASHHGTVRFDGCILRYAGNAVYTQANVFGFGQGDVTFTGGATFDTNGFTVTGKRYIAQNSGIVQWAGGTETSIPGSVAGTVEDTSVYWTAPLGGGFVFGPAASSNWAVPRFNGADGKRLNSSGVLLTDVDSLVGVAAIQTKGPAVIQSSVTSGDLLVLQGYNATGGTYSPFLTITNGPSAVADLAANVTIGGAYIYRVGGSKVAVADGGTGASTFNSNGVLYGSGTGPVLSTAQGGANSILTANAGAPTFSASPVIGTSLTCPLHIGGTAAGATLTLQSTSGVGAGDSVAIAGGNNGATPFGTFNATKLSLPQTTASTSSTTGALTVAGGVGVAGAIRSGGVIYAHSQYGFGTNNQVAFSTDGTTYNSLADTSSNAAFMAGGTGDPSNYFQNTTHIFRSRDGLTVYGQFANGHIYFPTAGTTASAANAFLNSASTPGNELLRSTSSISYKADFQSITLNDAMNTIMQLKPFTYRSLAIADDRERRYIGLGAEDVEIIDSRLINYLGDKPDGVQYERANLLMVPIVQHLVREVADLRAQLQRLN